MNECAEVIRSSLLSMQVCVPESWTDLSVENFAEHENPSGISGGWGIRRQDDNPLQGADERVFCRDRKGFVHIMLDA